MKNETTAPFSLPRLNYRKREAADAIGVSPRTLDNLLVATDPPPHVRIGRRVLFPVEALRAWLARRTVNAGGAR